MNNNESEKLIDSLFLITKGKVDIEIFKEKLNPNYTDSYGNSCFHFLTELSFEKFCIKNIKLVKNKDIINEKKYKEIKDYYIQQINSYINLLLSLNCDILFNNKSNQTPLILSIIKDNYILSKEYFKIQQKIGIFNEHNILDFIAIHGNTMDKDCLDLIDLVLTSTDINNNNIFNKAILNKEIKEYEITPIIWLCQDFSENIYNKYNQILKIKTNEYLINQQIDSNIIINALDQNIYADIKNKSLEEFNSFINSSFYPLLIKLIKLGANIHYNEDKHKYKKTSAFMYLMTYPFINNLSLFVKENNININYQDYLNNTPLLYLIYNKENIMKISKDIFYNTFNFFINEDSIQITKYNNKEESAFGLCLIKEYYDEAKLIFEKFKNTYLLNFYADILVFIIDAINKEENIGKINNLFKVFKDDININNFNKENKRSLLHYIFIYQSNVFIDLELLKQLFNILISLKFDINLKDQFNRNALFYLFLDENDKIKYKDLYHILEFCLQNFKFKNIYDSDIFGNNILYYAILSKAAKCINLLINYSENLNIPLCKNENSIYSASLLIGDLKLFIYLYNKNKDIRIFSNKVYEPYEAKKTENNSINYFNQNIEKDKGETLYDFLNKNNYILKTQLFPVKDNFNFNLNFNLNKNISSKKEFNYFNFQTDERIKILDEFTKNIIIDDRKNYSSVEIDNSNKKNIIINFMKKYDEYIIKRKNEERIVLANDLFSYCLSKNYQNLCKFMINEKYNLITICNDLILYHKFNDINECIKIILSQNNNDQNFLINYKNNEQQTIYHILSNVQNNLLFCKNLQNHNVSNLFDVYGNTPMYYACKNFNIIFIETFSNYSFNLTDNNNSKVNYSLFLETKNSKTPLEILYEKLNKNDNNVIKLIIDISTNMKKVYFIPIIKYLIQNYSPYNNKIFSLNYRDNFLSMEYFRKIIGLYQFYLRELNGSIMIKDEFGNDPFFICVENNNFNFLFNVLLEEHNITFNSTNKEGKSIIHLIVELPGYLNTYKEDKLKQALNFGFDFNIKDNEDMLPIDYAYLQEDFNIINILINYYTNLGISIPENRNIKPKNKINYNFCKDSDNLYNESISISAKIDKVENLNELVCSAFSNINNSSFYQVCVDENSIPYTANLVKKDFIFNDLNDMKYCIQIIKDLIDNKNNEYLLITVDNNLQLNQIKYNQFNEAEKKFKEIFKEKTGNDWDNVKNNKKNFETDYYKNYIFDYSFEEENTIYNYLKITIKNLYIEKKIEFKENKKIKNLIYYLLVNAYQNKFSIDDNSKDVETRTRDIIQQYKKTAIKKATSLLFDIKKLLQEKIKDETYIKKRNYLINSYNELIPYSNKSTNIILFDDIKSIDNEISKLTTYYYIENVLKIFLGAMYNLDKIHPLDYVINSLGCTFEEIPKPKNTEELITESDYIYNFLFTTGAEYNQIKTIYKITHSINDKNFNLKNFQNRFIFCHGTKVENIIGILSQGLKISPVQAKFTGKAFGSGIYLSDSFSFSLPYCYSKAINALGTKVFMILVEVAVGQIGVIADTNIVRMNLDFNDVFITNEGYGIFKNSKRVKTYNGIIVAHEETNVRIKYLVEIDKF